MKASTHRSMGYDNRMAVLREIVLSAPLSRAEIAHRLGLTEATVSRITRQLLDTAWVRELPLDEHASPSGPGRYAMHLDVNPKGGYVLGIGIGLTIQTVTLADLKNQTIEGTELKFSALDDPEFVINTIVKECLRLINAHVQDRRLLLGGFTMISGLVDPIQGIVRHSPYLRWENVPLRSKLVDLLGIPMKINSLSNSIALFETRFGTARGLENVLVTTCGVGIGTGVILNGRLVAGHHFNAGMVGIMEIPNKDGRFTTLDRVAGGQAVLQHLHGYDVERSELPVDRMSNDLFNAIKRDQRGYPDIVPLMSETGYALGLITIQAVRFIAPEMFVVAGPLAMSPSYMAGVKMAFMERLNTIPIEITASNVTGPISEQSASCGLAICEYLYENPQPSPA